MIGNKNLELELFHICKIRVDEILIAKVIEFDPKIRLTGINSHH